MGAILNGTGCTFRCWAPDASAVLVSFPTGTGGQVAMARDSTDPYPSYNIGFPQPGIWYLRFNSDWQAYSSDFGNVGYDTTAGSGSNQNMPFNGNVGLGAYSCCIYSQ